MGRATKNSGMKGLDLAADDPAGLSASELEPSPDGAAARAMGRAMGNSGMKSLDLAADDPAGLSASELEPSPGWRGGKSDGAGNGKFRNESCRHQRATHIRRQLRYYWKNG